MQLFQLTVRGSSQKNAVVLLTWRGGVWILHKYAEGEWLRGWKGHFLLSGENWIRRNETKHKSPSQSLVIRKHVQPGKSRESELLLHPRSLEHTAPFAPDCSPNVESPFLPKTSETRVESCWLEQSGFSVWIHLVAHVYDPSTWETEGGSQGPG